MSKISVVVMRLETSPGVRLAFEEWCGWSENRRLAQGLREVTERLQQRGVQPISLRAAGRRRCLLRIDSYSEESFATARMADELENLLDCVIFVTPTDFKWVQPALDQTSHDVTYFIVQARGVKKESR